ncbi:hypothetical protein [Enterobacter cloacae]|uniref:hypothetical protein n=1 Tax=Enterobacter cloacae TaxID=550 RepID=UPI002468AAAA|nr:hypothetical protein [Enterobacter cloacae]WGL80929.1 hypothetical protein QFB83_15875 [Enterobacter cloacae]
MSEQFDIFTGGRVEIAVSTQLDPDINFHDPSFQVINEILAFPELRMTREMSAIETYDSDTESKLLGSKTYEDTEIVVAMLPDDPVLEVLDDAEATKQLLRFRTFYVMDTAVDEVPGEQGYYRIYDAYVVGKSTTGENDAVVQNTYQLAIENMFDAGIGRRGNPLLTGDYGIGAGTADYPGIFDWTKLSGNRFVSFPGSSVHNPFGTDTGGIAVQGNDNQGFQIVASPDDKPRVRIRGVSGNKQGQWIKVYSEVEKPTPKEIGAVSLSGDIMTGGLFTPNMMTTNFMFAPSPGQETEAGNKRFIQTTNRSGEAVNIATMWHCGGKGFTEIDNINATTTLKDRGQLVYSPLNIPTPGVIGALPIRGGKLTGELDAPYISVHAPTLPTVALFSTDGTIPDDRDLACLTQSTNGDFRLIYRNSVTNTILSGITFEAGKSGNVYHTGNRPTAADIGAIDHNDTVDLGTF